MLRIILSLFIFSTLFCAEYSISQVNDIIGKDVQKLKEAILVDDWSSYQVAEKNIEKYLAFGVHKNYPDYATQILLYSSVRGKDVLRKALPIIDKLAPTSGKVLTLKISSLLNLKMLKEAGSAAIQFIKIIPQRGDYIFEITGSLLFMVGKGLLFVSMIIAISLLANSSDMFLTRFRHKFKIKNHIVNLLILTCLLSLAICFPNFCILLFIALASFIMKEVAPLVKYAFLGSIFVCLGSFLIPLSTYWFDSSGYREAYEINSQSFVPNLKVNGRNNLSHWMRAQVERAKGNPEEAGKFLAKNNSLKLPQYINLERGNLAYYAQKYQEANDFYQKAGSFDTASYYYNLSKIKFKLNEVDTSFSLLKNAKKLDPGISSNADETSETNLMLVEPLPDYLIFRVLVKYIGFRDLWQRPLFEAIILTAIIFFYVLLSGFRNTSEIKSDFQVSTTSLALAIMNILVPFRAHVKYKRFFASIMTVVILSVCITLLRLAIPNLNFSAVFPIPVMIASGFLFLTSAFITNLLSKGYSGR